MGGVTPWWLAVAISVIAAFGVLVAATLTAYAAAARERAARRTEHESARLAELLEAAIELRERLYALGTSPDAGRAQTTAFERAAATFLARRQAVLAPSVRRLAAEWEDAASRQVASMAAGDGHGEPAAWHALVTEIGVARRRVL